MVMDGAGMTGDMVVRVTVEMSGVGGTDPQATLVLTKMQETLAAAWRTGEKEEKSGSYLTLETVSCPKICVSLK